MIDSDHSIENCIDRTVQELKQQHSIVLQVKWDHSRDQLNLIMLHVPETKRKQGIAHQVMRSFCDLADQYQFNMMLQPSSAFGTPLKVLIALYLKYGFHLQTVDCMYRFYSDKKNRKKL